MSLFFASRRCHNSARTSDPSPSRDAIVLVAYFRAAEMTHGRIVPHVPTIVPPVARSGEEEMQEVAWCPTLLVFGTCLGEGSLGVPGMRCFFFSDG